MFNNNFQNPVQNNLNPQQNGLPAQNPQQNPMLQYYQQLMGQVQPQQQAQDPRIAEMLEEYKKIPAVAEEIKMYEDFKKETANLEYKINKGFEDYYKSKTDPQFSQMADLRAKLENIEKLLGGKQNG